MKVELSEEIKQSCLAFAKQMLAAGAAWQDCTSYSQGQKERIPTAFETTIAGCRIVITCAHIYYRGEWIFNCSKLGMEQVLLNVADAQSAAEKAVGICRDYVKKLHSAFSACG